MRTDVSRAPWLSESTRAQVLTDLRAGLGHRIIAERNSVHRTTVGRLARQLGISPMPNTERLALARQALIDRYGVAAKPRPKLSPDQRARIRAARADGATLRSLATHFGVSHETIRTSLKGDA